MTPDSIVDEVRAIREEIARECRYDIDVIFQRLRGMAADGTHPRVSLPPRKLAEPNGDQPPASRGAA